MVGDKATAVALALACLIKERHEGNREFFIGYVISLHDALNYTILLIFLVVRLSSWFNLALAKLIHQQVRLSGGLGQAMFTSAIPDYLYRIV